MDWFANNRNTRGRIHTQERTYLAPFLAVREIAVTREASGSEGFAWAWVLRSLKDNRDNRHVNSENIQKVKER